MRKISLWILASLFVGSGSLHLVRPRPFIQIVPPALPRPDLMVCFSGMAEIAGGLGILIPRLRPAARVALVVLLAAVFPANVYMAIDHIKPTEISIPNSLLWARLPLQPLLMWWVLVATRKLDRPDRSHAAAAGGKTQSGITL